MQDMEIARLLQEQEEMRKRQEEEARRNQELMMLSQPKQQQQQSGGPMGGMNPMSMMGGQGGMGSMFGGGSAGAASGGGSAAGAAGASGGSAGGSAAASGASSLMSFWPAAVVAAAVGNELNAKHEGRRDSDAFTGESALTGRAMYKDADHLTEQGNKIFDGLGDGWGLAANMSSPLDLFRGDTWSDAWDHAKRGGVLGGLVRKIF